MGGLDSNGFIVGIVGNLVAASIVYVIGRLAKIRAVPIPMWGIAIVVGILGFVVYFEYQRRSPNLVTVYNKNFGVERIVLDGKAFVNCTFDRSELVFLGQKHFHLVRSRLTGVRLKLEGNAQGTIIGLKKMYEDPSFRPYIDNFLKDITKTE
jgi:hypothetical protein